MKTATLDNPQVQTVRYNGEPYEAVKPQPDSDKLAALGRRVILYHRHFGAGLHTAELQIAPAGLVCAGLVIGGIEGPGPESSVVGGPIRGLRINVIRSDEVESLLTDLEQDPPLLHTNIPRSRSGDNLNRAIDLQPASDVHSWEGGDR